jgi:cystathionine beta-lyase family protein involved in aluminum resistance
MEEVIGLRGAPGSGSLADWGVRYRCLALAPGGGVDWDALATAIRPGEPELR